MKLYGRNPKIYLATCLMLLMVVGVIGWWTAPVNVESLNRMAYCACGYCKVRFKDGLITVVEHYHEPPKPGDVIGRYTMTNRDIELEIYFNGKTNVIRCRLDNIGLRTPPGSRFEYIAFDDHSLKPYIYHIARKIFDFQKLR